jgi:hypothetical protein
MKSKLNGYIRLINKEVIMKKNLLVVVSVLFGCAISSLALSEDMGKSAAPTATSSNVMNPCKQIVVACKSAKKGSNRRETWNNCVKPILAGQTVAGVTADPKDVQACQTKMQNDPCRKVIEACKSAKKESNRRETWNNCVKPILDGQTVTGVTPDAKDVQACQTKIQNDPCRKVIGACRSAKKGNNRRETWNNCVKPILAGQTVAGVTPDPKDVQACQARMHKQ